MAADEEINVEVNSNIGEVAKDTKEATEELSLFKKGIKGMFDYGRKIYNQRR